MMNDEQMHPAQRLVTPDEYAASRAHVFPSSESLRWFERQHRGELVKSGAVVMPAGRKMVDPVAFDGAVMTIGQRLAAARGGVK